MEYLITAVALLSVDIIWIGFIARGLYEKLVISVQKSPLRVNYIAAIITYILLVIGLVNFVINRRDLSIWWTVYYGMLFGAVVYGVFDFTNMSIFNNWNVSVAIIDVIWGAVLCGLVAGIVKYILLNY